MENQIIICPHCGNETIQEIKYNLKVCRDVFDSDNTYLGQFDFYFYLIECKTCKEITLLLTSEVFDNPDDLRDAIILYPSAKKIWMRTYRKLSGIFTEKRKGSRKNHRALLLFS